MSDSYGDPQQNSSNFDRRRGGFRGGRPPGNRDTGGFRIRLSDNEMKAARSLQEAFNLRSTVAVLGFALRTLAQMLQEGKLEEILSEYQNQEQRGNYNHKGFNQRDGKKNFEGNFNKNPKPNPFARPDKPSVNSQEQTNIEEAENSEDHNKVSTQEVLPEASKEVSDNDLNSSENS
ncbi:MULTISPECIES: hypothetical protein [Prochlorococcus]|uniref:hypothetical protein n=1 Tax=Prochlorococcus TaxID=1218 RepID=UPI000533B1E9|nr:MULTISPECIES: hypothetical protein [Prochlorococcus]KGG12295.1 hypothetical protein EV05_1505 [Prochlorococcus sp. MIT 0601]